MYEAFGLKLEQAVATLEIECEYKRRKVFRSFFRMLMLCVLVYVRCEPRHDSTTHIVMGRNDNINPRRHVVGFIDDFFRLVLFYTGSRRVLRNWS